MKRFFLHFLHVFLLILLPFPGFCQEEGLIDAIEKNAENLEPENLAPQMEELIDLTTKPVNLNKASEDDLEGIPFLSSHQRRSLSDYIRTYGELVSMYELASIPGFDSSLVGKIEPYIYLAQVRKIPSPSPGNLFKYGHHDLLLRYGQLFPQAAGYLVNDSIDGQNSEPCYQGSPQRYYFRYSYQWFDKIKAGFAGEKDPGEQFFKGSQPYGMDYYAGYVSLNNVGIIKNLVLGNFRVSYGQGLTMGTGVALGSMPGFPTALNQVSGIRPSLSMNEGNYFRGVAFSLKRNHFEYGGFVSYHPRDATITIPDSLDQAKNEVTSLINTGYHRNTQELAKKNTVKELVYGGNVSFTMAPNINFGFKVGFTAISYQYNVIVAPTPHPYNQFGFCGSGNSNLGIHLQLRHPCCHVFGEVGRSENNGFACVVGAEITPDPRVGITLIYRNYGIQYQNMFSNAFGQNSINSNERGIYMALNASMCRWLSLSGYIDLFTFPWLRYRVDAPTHGIEFGLMANIQATQKVVVNFRYHQKSANQNQTSGADLKIHRLADQITSDFRFHLGWAPLVNVSLNSRMEVKCAGEKNGEKPMGFLLFQDVRIKTVFWPITLAMRYTLFDIPDYNCRIYVYEPDVLYGFSVPAFQGKGMGFCIVFSTGIGRRYKLWLRGGYTYYTDRDATGSGLEERTGNDRLELTAQFMVKL